MCQKAMYRYTDAFKTFDRFLVESGLKEDAPLYREVVAEKAFLLTKVGRLEINAAPVGANVSIDGQKLG